jgi:hypothetical protein
VLRTRRPGVRSDQQRGLPATIRVAAFQNRRPTPHACAIGPAIAARAGYLAVTVSCLHRGSAGCSRVHPGSTSPNLTDPGLGRTEAQGCAPEVNIGTSLFRACQGWGRGFESLRPLQFFPTRKMLLKRSARARAARRRSPDHYGAGKTGAGQLPAVTVKLCSASFLPPCQIWKVQVPGTISQSCSIP